MSQLIDNLNLIVSIKSDIKSAIENKGVDMTGVSFGSYADKIGEISGGGGVDPSGTLEISENGVYDVYSYASASVNVPQSVTGFTEKEITEQAFTIINLSNSASYVASRAFYNNKTIQTVNLPYATSIDYAAFSNCTSLSQVSLPMCSYIGRYAFWECVSLLQVNLPVCSKIDAFAFNACYSLTQVSLPVCSHIGDYAFQQCNSLSEVSLPVCNHIGKSAFQQCNNLSSIVLPMVTNIEQNAFKDCIMFGQITLGASSVCSISDITLFLNTLISSSTGSIYVPSSLVNDYKTARYWRIFSTQIFPIPE